MNSVKKSTFTVSDVSSASQPLHEIPYPHALAGLIDAQPGYMEINWLDQAIAKAERMLLDPRHRFGDHLPPGVVNNRPIAFAEEADVRPEEQEHGFRVSQGDLAELTQQRAQRFAELEALQKTARHGIEACSRYRGKLVAGIALHPLIEALHLAFNDHRPVSLSPDMIWLLIAQGTANHFNANADTLRTQFVQHLGKIKLRVDRHDFVKGSPENPWPEVFPEFTRQIREHVGSDTHDFFIPRFSTTSPMETASFELTLMDAMQSYFVFECHTLCGIPELTIEGTSDDWSAILERVRQLPRFGLDWWAPTLEVILNHFIEAAEGRPDVDFWRSIFKYQSFSGGDSVTGWITAFFPYFKAEQTGLPSSKNPWLEEGGTNLEKLLRPPGAGPQAFASGPALECLPSGLARAPMVWHYLDQVFDMEFLGGFVGVAQDAQTLCLRPEIGWAVRDVNSVQPGPATAAVRRRSRGLE
jgi:Domain of unknown function (DUF4419)